MWSSRPIPVAWSGVLFLLMSTRPIGTAFAAGTTLPDSLGQWYKPNKKRQVCHRDAAPRERILGADAATTLRQLERALQARNRKDVGRRLGETAVKACARCHRVHRTLSEIQRHLFD